MIYRLLKERLPLQPPFEEMLTFYACFFGYAPISFLSENNYLTKFNQVGMNLYFNAGLWKHFELD